MTKQLILKLLPDTLLISSLFLLQDFLGHLKKISHEKKVLIYCFTVFCFIIAGPNPLAKCFIKRDGITTELNRKFMGMGKPC
jgi:hypothetical protein